VPFFRNPGLVGHEHPAGIGQVLQYIAAQVITHRISIPDVEVQQSLHAVRAQIAGLFGDRPGVLAFGTREQSQQVQPGSMPGLHLREPACDQGEHLVEPGLPPAQTIIG
jgi:hypothetical protein